MSSSTDPPVLKTNKHWCQYCRIFVTNLKHHENGNRHQQNVRHFLLQQKQRNAKREKEKNATEREFERIERAAQQALRKDVQSGAALKTDSTAAGLIAAQQRQLEQQQKQRQHQNQWKQQQQQHQHSRAPYHQYSYPQQAMAYPQYPQEQQAIQSQQMYANYDPYQGMSPEQRTYYEQYYKQYYQHYYGVNAAAENATPATADAGSTVRNDDDEDAGIPGLDSSDANAMGQSTQPQQLQMQKTVGDQDQTPEIPVDTQQREEIVVEKKDSNDSIVEEHVSEAVEEIASDDDENVEYVEEIVEVFEDEDGNEIGEEATGDLPDAYYSDPNFFFSMESYETSKKLEEKEKQEAEKRQLERQRLSEEEKEQKKRREREQKIEKMKKEYEKEHGREVAPVSGSGIGSWSRVETTDVQRIPTSRRPGQSPSKETEKTKDNDSHSESAAAGDDEDEDEQYDFHIDADEDDDRFATSSYQYRSSSAMSPANKKRILLQIEEKMDDRSKKQKTGGAISFQIRPVTKKGSVKR